MIRNLNSHCYNKTTNAGMNAVRNIEVYNASKKFVSIISDRDRVIFETVNYVFVSSIICLFGITTNVMNIVVFYKQGFSNAMTISFFGLAISDLISLVMSLGVGVFVNPLLINADTNIIPQEILHLTVGLPHISSTRITSWITVFITAERCLCITLPLKIKQIITPRRTTIIVISIYIMVMSCSIHEYSTIYFDYKYYIPKNRTLLGMIYRKGYAVEGLAYFLHSVLGLSSFVAVITFTVILVIQLKRKSKWRMKAAVDKAQTESISTRERKAMTMVVMIAIILIVCYAPGAAVSMVGLFEIEFSIIGKYANECFAFWSFGFVFDSINSSVNIFLYYYMSTKYRETFRVIFACITSNGAP